MFDELQRKRAGLICNASLRAGLEAHQAKNSSTASLLVKPTPPNINLRSVRFSMFNKERELPRIPPRRVCLYKAALWRIQQGTPAMMLFPAVMVGGQLVIAVADRPPKLNFEPICRESESDSRKVSICVDDERAARDQLTAQWSEFNATDRTRCVRPSTINRSASYIEVLTCLEMERAARKLPKTMGVGVDLLAPEPAEEKTTAPIRSSRPPSPQQPVSILPPAPPPQSSPWTGALQVLCLPGLKDILSACSDLP